MKGELSMNRPRIRRVIVTVLSVLLLLAALVPATIQAQPRPAVVATPKTPTRTPTPLQVRFYGQVLEPAALAPIPIPDVTVRLYARPTKLTQAWTQVGETKTDKAGAFALSTNWGKLTDYRVVEEDPPTHMSASAVAPTEGTVIDPNTVQFYLASAGSHEGIIFYDRRKPTPTPTSTSRPSVVFQGEVVIDRSVPREPRAGVVVQLWKRTGINRFYTFVKGTSTDKHGFFELTDPWSPLNDYRVVEIDPAGFDSTRALLPSQSPTKGTVVSENVVEFQDAVATKAYRLISFRDVRATPTRTPTPTNTPTRTRTPTRTPTPSTDLISQRLEVTQAIQDLYTSVRLVRNKRTFVRYHVRSTSGYHSTWALLRAQRGGSTRWLFPKNPVTVRPSPDRGVLNHSFLFELPSGFKQGTVSLTAYLNPVIPFLRPKRNPLETYYGNNSTSKTVSFETVSPINVVVYRVGYRYQGTIYYPPWSDLFQMTNWLRKAYPVSSVKVWYRSTYFGNAVVNSQGKMTYPSCGSVNSYMMSKKIWDILLGKVPFGAHYYGMVSDGGKFMRGCAAGIPAWVSSGPTGPGTWGWDTDGSYGDWYGGHELGHTYGRGHANYCGAGGGPWYPYPGGRISPSTSGNSAIYGFDIHTRAIYGPTWRDVMTYCDNLWVSDFTYEALMTYFKTHTTSGEVSLNASEAVDRLIVSGVYDGIAKTVALNPLFVIPDVPEVEPRTPGAFAIVLRDAADKELARYPFTAIPMDDGAPPVGEPPEESDLRLIEEAVPYVEGTTRVDIELYGKVLASVTAGLGAPTVTVQSPNGGETVDSDPVAVSWKATDPDGAPMSYMVQYSRDNGASWEILAQNLTEKSVLLDSENVGSTTEGLFRVWASDGIHTASDRSNGTFTVPNHSPAVQIIEPASDITVAISQTVGLVGDAFDPDTGTMEDEQLTWSSNRDGSLGTGPLASIATLSVGKHVITLTGDDGEGGVDTDTVRVTVVGSLEELPSVEDKLLAGPPLITLDTSIGVTVSFHFRQYFPPAWYIPCAQ